MGKAYRPVHDLNALFHVTHGLARLVLYAAYEFLYLFRALRASFGEFSHLFGHHGEAQAVLAGAGGLYRGVKREEVRLLGYVVYDLHYLADILRLGAEYLYRLHGRTHGRRDGPHPFRGLLHGALAGYDDGAALPRYVNEPLRIIGDLLYRGDEFLYGRGRLGHGNRLLLHTPRDVPDIGAHLVHGRGYLLDRRTGVLDVPLRLLGRCRYLA